MRSSRRARSSSSGRYNRRRNRSRSCPRGGRSRSRPGRKRSPSPRRRRSRSQSFRRRRSRSGQGDRKARQNVLSQAPPSTAGATPQPQMTPQPVMSDLGMGHDYKFIQIPQEVVGAVLGYQGQQLQACERQTGCTISINQSMQHQGYSTAQISGPNALATDAAIAIITERMQFQQRRLLKESQLGTGGLEEFEIDQREVGAIVGRGGEILRELQQRTNTNIQVNTRDRTAKTCIVHIDGSPEAVATAKNLIMQKIMEHNFREGHQSAYNIRINPTNVAKFVGKGFQHVNAIRSQCGVDIFVDKKKEESEGYATIRIAPGAGADAAYQLVKEKLNRMGAQILGNDGPGMCVGRPSMTMPPTGPALGQVPGMIPPRPPGAALFGQAPVCGQCGLPDTSGLGAVRDGKLVCGPCFLGQSRPPPPPEPAPPLPF